MIAEEKIIDETRQGEAVVVPSNGFAKKKMYAHATLHIHMFISIRLSSHITFYIYFIFVSFVKLYFNLVV